MIRGPLHRRLVVVAAIAAATLVALGPLLVFGFPASGWDSAHHAMTARQFSDQLRGGEIYPRWLIDRNYGLGSPHLFYYAPLSYYVSSLLDFGRDPTGLAPLTRSTFVLLFLSGLTCHAWLRRVVDPIPALAGSVLYVALPYHVFVDLFIRGAYAEFSTFVWLPVPMLGVELLRERRAAGLPVLALGFAGMVLSNILTGPIFAAVPTVYAVGRTWGEGRLGRVVLAAAGTALGLSISAAYLWPALVQQSEVFVPVTSILPKYFLFAEDRPEEKLFALTRLMFFAYAALLVGLAVVLRRRATSFEVTLGLFALGGMFMLTIPARPLYDHLRPLEALQYPYRMYTLVEIAVTGLAASALSRAKRPLALAGAVAGVLGLVTGVAAVRTGHFERDEGLWERRVRYASDYGLFRPTSTRRLPTDDRRLFMKGYHGPDVPPLPRVRVTRGEAHVEVTRWRPRDIALSVEGGPATLVVGQLYYPGWEATLASGTPVDVTPTQAEGLVQMEMPGGPVEVSLRLVARPAERLGLLATSLGLLALGGATLALLRAWAHREGSG